LYQNCDIALFFSFVNLPLRFPKRSTTLPLFHYPPNDVNFCTKGQIYPYDFAHGLFGLFVFLSLICNTAFGQICLAEFAIILIQI
jgi:hypothetical protein